MTKRTDVKLDGTKCYCPLYMCPREDDCKLKDAYIKQYPIEILSEDAEIPEWDKKDFNRVYKRFNSGNLFTA